MAEKLAVVVGGGPAPGINGVISAVTFEAIKHGLDVVGIYDGFKWLSKGDTSHTLKLGDGETTRIHLRGGSIIGTSRDNPTKSPEKMANVVKSLTGLGVRYLVTIGGDDTAYTATRVEEEAKGKIAVCHVPKTIDNDLPLPHGVPTFGFETARSLGTQLVENLMEDARTAGRWYLVIAMGRSAGHLALGMGMGAGATLTLIPEELGENISLNKVLAILEGAIIKRLSYGRNHGVAVIAEGVAIRFNPEELTILQDVPRDDHGNIRLAEIPLGDMLKARVQENLAALGIKMTVIAKDIGYELRCHPPISYDREYTRYLGFSAVKFLVSGGTGAMIMLKDGKNVPIKFADLLDPQTGKTRIRRVDPKSDDYLMARRYMIRLEKADMEGEALAALAKTANMSPGDFKKRYAVAVE
ncbi:MAG: 6-phosphofructokinase [Nitrospirae bacterium GWC2_57_13]|jgi:ATP-dependent phosphofructokinase / diphosphate-dependent phosphofructokinase|nr:MAG: 6-phosphofructokinase [Nitrospirae bacterium GWC2_57_13]HAR46737.1 6-phosphofructokinase [Nitrospiraceae bacterium]